MVEHSNKCSEIKGLKPATTEYWDKIVDTYTHTPIYIYIYVCVCVCVCVCACVCIIEVHVLDIYASKLSSKAATDIKFSHLLKNLILFNYILEF